MRERVLTTVTLRQTTGSWASATPDPGAGTATDVPAPGIGDPAPRPARAAWSPAKISSLTPVEPDSVSPRQPRHEGEPEMRQLLGQLAMTHPSHLKAAVLHAHPQPRDRRPRRR